MFGSILIVCTGNICRSPIAERMLRHALPEKKVDSAGVRALVGHIADDSAIKVSEQNQLLLDSHRAQQFDRSMGQRYDLILVMEKHHIEQITLIAPEARGKTMLIGHWLNKVEIPDPYRKSMESFEYVYRLLDKACNSWVRKLSG